MQATAKDLRFHSKEILETVSRGEEVVITYRGKPHAKLIPYKPVSNSITGENQLFGIWKDNKTVKNVYNHIREQRKGRF
jgi:prevent-host-death family protein